MNDESEIRTYRSRLASSADRYSKKQKEFRELKTRFNALQAENKMLKVENQKLLVHLKLIIKSHRVTLDEFKKEDELHIAEKEKWREAFAKLKKAYSMQLELNRKSNKDRIDTIVTTALTKGVDKLMLFAEEQVTKLKETQSMFHARFDSINWSKEVNWRDGQQKCQENNKWKSSRARPSIFEEEKSPRKDGLDDTPDLSIIHGPTDIIRGERSGDDGENEPMIIIHDPNEDTSNEPSGLSEHKPEE